MVNWFQKMETEQTFIDMAAIRNKFTLPPHAAPYNTFFFKMSSSKMATSLGKGSIINLEVNLTSQ